VFGHVLFQAGDGQGHTIRQLPFLGSRELSEPHQASHPVARFEELTFEPSMLRTVYSQGRKGAHRAPVENAEWEDNNKANKKQTLFSPFVRVEP
jgi:hypothetical protein